eukprot:6049589-Prymnesium_polylepis.1
MPAPACGSAHTLVTAAHGVTAPLSRCDASADPIATRGSPDTSGGGRPAAPHHGAADHATRWRPQCLSASVGGGAPYA